MLAHAPWASLPGLIHGFLDARESAPSDLGAALRALGLDVSLYTARQVHGTAVAIATANGPRQDADAILVTESGIAAGIVTADCVPILLLAPENGAAVAIHAGWRGAAAGVIEAALDALRARVGTTAGVEGVIGPAIGGCCYQVGNEVAQAFRTRLGHITETAWRRDGDRWRLDLRTAVGSLLRASGVHRPTVLGPCTYCGAGYNSFRRDGRRAGRQLSFIGWTTRR